MATTDRLTDMARGLAEYSEYLWAADRQYKAVVIGDLAMEAKRMANYERMINAEAIPVHSI